MATLLPDFIQSLVETHQSPFVLIDGDRRIVCANRAYGATYGIDVERVVGRYCYEVSHHRDSPCHLAGEDCPYQKVMETGAPHEVVHVHSDAQGHEDRVRIRGVPVRGPDGQLLVGETINRLAPYAEADREDMRMIGRSPAMLEAIERLSRAAAINANVLLHGESGVGKELAAHHLHQRGPRGARRFIAVNCAALSDTLFESEMFGHERGAFTGCIGRKPGLLEQAHGGTLFLDEVTEIPLPLQAKLLRVLESGELRRLGGNETLRVDVRLITATNRSLFEIVKAGRFREDLYYRLACITIRLPALRERRSDIPALAEALLLRIGRAHGRRYLLSGEALACLMRYDFPGNVRELRNLLERGATFCAGGVIGERELGLDTAVAAGAMEALEPGPVTRLKDLECRHIAELLEQHSGNRRRVAEALGISERTLYRKLKRYGFGEQVPV